jgi:hypothetical protein
VPDSNPRNPEEAARLAAARASLPDIPGVDVELVFMDDAEIVDRIDAEDAAVFASAAGFGLYKGEGLPLLPAIEMEGLEYIEAALRTGRLRCGTYGIGNEFPAGHPCPLFAHFQLHIRQPGQLEEKYVPLHIGIEDAPEEWVGQAMRRFIVVWPPGDDGTRAYMATGPMQQFPAGVVVPPKITRNDPCPCGSGEKYKRCHGR